MKGKQKFLDSMQACVDLSNKDIIGEIAIVIEACAVFAEDNTNETGQYSVGDHIAQMLRNLRGEVCGYMVTGGTGFYYGGKE